MSLGGFLNSSKRYLSSLMTMILRLSFGLFGRVIITWSVSGTNLFLALFCLLLWIVLCGLIKLLIAECECACPLVRLRSIAVILLFWSFFFESLRKESGDNFLHLV